MMRRTLCTAAAFFAAALSLPAQEVATGETTTRPADLSLSQAHPNDLVEGPVAVERTGSFRALNNLWYGRGPLTLRDGRFFTFPTAFGWVEGTPADFLPAFTARPLPRLVPTGLLGYDSGADLNLERQGDYAGGEVGVFYGKSIGKYGREVKAGYILGEITHGNTHITVGASYEESNGRRPLLIGH